MTSETVSVPQWTPPKWLNSLMNLMLRTPGLQRLVGRSTALVTVTGRLSGKRYTTPVTYYRQGDEVIVLSKVGRTWWRNLEARPEVELRLAGRSVRGVATASTGDEDDLAPLISFLENRRRDAKPYGVAFPGGGKVNREQARMLLPMVVVVRIALG